MAIVFVSLPWSAAPAAAHADVVVVEGIHRVLPGSAATFPVDLHYHRLVGHVRVEAPSGGAVAVLLKGPEGIARPVAGPDGDLTVNVLVPCCKGEAWTKYDIVLENRGAAAAHVDVRLTVLHDGVAVLGDDAETGAAATPALLFGGFSLLFASRLRRAPHGGGAGPREWAVRSAALFATLWLVAAALAGWGILRYGGGPVAATVAATADLPATGNVILNTHSIVILVFMALSIASVGAWTEAARRAADERKAVGALGVIVGVGAVAACAIWAGEYGRILVPAIIAVATAAYPLGGGLLLLRRSARS